MKCRLVIERNLDTMYPWQVSEVDADGSITGSLGTYETVEAAEAKWPETRWSERVPESWKPDVVRVGPWYDDEALPYD